MSSSIHTIFFTFFSILFVNEKKTRVGQVGLYVIPHIYHRKRFNSNKSFVSSNFRLLHSRYRYYLIWTSIINFPWKAFCCENQGSMTFFILRFRQSMKKFAKMCSLSSFQTWFYLSLAVYTSTLSVSHHFVDLHFFKFFKWDDYATIKEKFRIFFIPPNVRYSGHFVKIWATYIILIVKESREINFNFHSALISIFCRQLCHLSSTIRQK